MLQQSYQLYLQALYIEREKEREKERERERELSWKCLNMLSGISGLLGLLGLLLASSMIRLVLSHCT